MIPPVVVFSAMLAGSALAAGVVALMMRGPPARRQLSTPFCAMSLGLAMFALAQLVRNACPDLTSGDIACRILGLGVAVFAGATMVLYRRLTGAESTWFYRLILAVLILFGLHAVASPGGQFFLRIERIDHLDLGWWGPITVLQGPLDPLTTPWFVLCLVVISHTSTCVWRARRVLGTTTTGLLLLPPLAFLVPIIHGYGLRQGWWSGLPLGEYAMTTMYLSSAAALYRRERELHADMLRRRNQIDAVLEHGLGLCGLLDLDGRLVLANRTALTLAGVEAQAVIGLPFADTPWWSHSADARRRLNEAIARAAAGQADRFATTHPLPDGSMADVDFSLTPYRGADGRVEYLIAEGRDISELKLYDRIVRESSKMDAVGQLAGGIAHDFNNVLGGIMGAAELALMRNRDETIRQYLETIISASGRAGDLTRRLLAFARKGKVVERPLSANDLVREALELFTRTANADLRIELDLAASPDVLLGDPSEMQSSLLNLCINARDAMPAGGRLRLATSRQVLSQALSDAVGHAIPCGTYIRIEVTDHGSGIAPEVIGRIFEPFFTTKAEGHGTGLGLPAVLGTAHAHGGGVLLTTVVGQGTSVAMLLPASNAPLSDWHAPVPTTKANGELVVLVDDEPSIQRQARELLVSIGFQVEDFSDPLVARERLRSVAGVHCVILDLAMPGLNGRELYRLLRAEHADLPIIISSGYAGGGQVVGGADDQRLAFLPKPWRLGQLCEVLTRLRALPERPS